MSAFYLAISSLWQIHCSDLEKLIRYILWLLLVTIKLYIFFIYFKNSLPADCSDKWSIGLCAFEPVKFYKQRYLLENFVFDTVSFITFVIVIRSIKECWVPQGKINDEAYFRTVKFRNQSPLTITKYNCVNTWGAILSLCVLIIM